MTTTTLPGGQNHALGAQETRRGRDGRQRERATAYGKTHGGGGTRQKQNTLTHNSSVYTITIILHFIIILYLYDNNVAARRADKMLSGCSESNPSAAERPQRSGDGGDNDAGRRQSLPDLGQAG